MKRHTLSLLALLAVPLIAGFVFTACSGTKRIEQETKLFQNLSIEELVRRVNSPELKGSTGGSSYSSTPGIYSRREFSLIYNIEEGAGAKFDEAAFLAKLKAEAEKEADDAGARRTNSGAGGDTFHFDYADGNREGWVEIVGARIDGNRYKIWCVLRENTKNVR